MRGARLVVSLVLSALVWLPPSARAADAPLSVQIVPTGARGSERSIELYQPGAHFHVTLTNKTKQPIRLWKEWCSWGYFNLSFEARGADGKVTRIHKRDRGWDKNFADS